MRIRAKEELFKAKDHSGSQKVRAEQSGQAWSTTQSNSTEAVSSASKQKCHGSAFPKSRNQKRANRRRKNRRETVNGTKSNKHDTTAQAVGLKCTDSKYDTIAPAVGPKYKKVSEERAEGTEELVKVILRSNNLGALKARIVIQLGGEVHTTQEQLRVSNTVEKPTVVVGEANLLTKSAAGVSGKKSNNKSGPNSQGPQKSNFKSWNKSFGRNNKKNKGYRSPNSDKKNSISTRSYRPFTETQKRNFSRLLKETLVSDC
jgi:hypothetical protein